MENENENKKKKKENTKNKKQTYVHATTHTRAHLGLGEDLVSVYGSYRATHVLNYQRWSMFGRLAM